MGEKYTLYPPRDHIIRLVTDDFLWQGKETKNRLERTLCKTIKERRRKGGRGITVGHQYLGIQFQSSARIQYDYLIEIFSDPAINFNRSLGNSAIFRTPKVPYKRRNISTSIN